MKKHTTLDTLFSYAGLTGFGDIHFHFERVTGFTAIIAIHSLKRGSAIGGCRLLTYPDAEAAVLDALRLARMMSFKSAIHGMAHGGAKAVIIKPKIIRDRRAFFHTFGNFVESLGGRYVTAIDSGTGSQDMDYVHEKTSYVTCISEGGVPQDPSPHTARGVRCGIEAAVRFRLGKTSLGGLRIAVQGGGHVGYYLAKDLISRGAQVFLSDINPVQVQKCVDALGVVPVPPEKIYDMEADVFSPCALGAILNHDTIERLKVSVVAGSANNQLAHARNAARLQAKNILYAPDFVINAGGLIYVAAIYDKTDCTAALQQVDHIGDALTKIFEEAEKSHLPTQQVAEKMAGEILSKAGKDAAHA